MEICGENALTSQRSIDQQLRINQIQDAAALACEAVAFFCALCSALCSPVGICLVVLCLEVLPVPVLVLPLDVDLHCFSLSSRWICRYLAALFM